MTVLQLIALRAADFFAAMGPLAAGYPYKFDHYFIDNTVSVPLRPFSLLDFDKVNTSFYNPSTPNTIIRDAILQTALDNLIENNPDYKNNKSNFAVSIVNLTAPHKDTPLYAGFNDQKIFAAESAVKIAGLYAIYQLKADVNEFIDRRSDITDFNTLETELMKEWKSKNKDPRDNTKDLIPTDYYPKLKYIFDSDEFNNHRTIQFRNSAVTREDMSHPSKDVLLVERLNKISFGLKGNMHGSECGATPFVLLGLPYVGSVMISSGLFEPDHNGLWENVGFQKINYMDLPQSKQHLGWSSGRPFQKLNQHNINAISAALFFTLCAQGKLIDAQSSQDMLNHIEISPTLRGGCDADVIDETKYENAKVYAKCGFYPDGAAADNLHVPLYFKSTKSSKECIINIFTANGKWPIVNSLFNDLFSMF